MGDEGHKDRIVREVYRSRVLGLQPTFIKAGSGFGEDAATATAQAVPWDREMIPAATKCCVALATLEIYRSWGGFFVLTRSAIQSSDLDLSQEGGYSYVKFIGRFNQKDRLSP